MNHNNMPGSLPSAMTADFSKVPDVRIERSKFKRNHTLKTTFDAGYLVPFFLDEVIPGDTHTVEVDIFGRLATPIKPTMDNMFMDTMFFFVPMRLVWDNTDRFFGERRPDPDSSIDYVIPTVDMPATTGGTTNSLWDYMGLPIGIADLPVNALPLRAYNKIYNDWFRDENLIDSVVERTSDSGDLPDDFTLLKSGKRYDYFTSCLTEAQKGDPVAIPVGADSAPVTRVSNAAAWQAFDAGADTQTNASNLALYIDTGGRLQQDTTTIDKSLDPMGGLIADLSSAFATTINDFRYAVQLQALLEKDARGGTRYIEHNWVHFGVKSSDARLQRPEYLGGGSSPVNVHPVAQTTPTASPTLVSAQGNLAGFGTVSARGHGFSRSFEEHGYIIGLVRARADLTYQQGLDRLWSRSTRYDFPYPVFAHIGEQAVLSKEIFCDGGNDDDDVFGYQERYAEYRYKRSSITGQFRSSAATPLDYWHLSQEFQTRPVLDETFITEDPPIDRIIAVTSEPHFMFDSFIKQTSARPLPVYSIPTLGGRF